jgi:hypothetical protein
MLTKLKMWSLQKMFILHTVFPRENLMEELAVEQT